MKLTATRLPLPAIFPPTPRLLLRSREDDHRRGQCIDDVSEISAIGHRVVHGGEKFKVSCLITDEVINTIRELSPWVLCTKSRGILGIEAARKVFGNVSMVAVFDTAFHSTNAPEGLYVRHPLCVL